MRKFLLSTALAVAALAAVVLTPADAEAQLFRSRRNFAYDTSYYTPGGYYGYSRGAYFGQPYVVESRVVTPTYSTWYSPAVAYPSFGYTYPSYGYVNTPYYSRGYVNMPYYSRGYESTPCYSGAYMATPYGYAEQRALRYPAYYYFR